MVGTSCLAHCRNGCNKQNNGLHGDARRGDNGRRGILSIAARPSPIAGAAAATRTVAVAAVSTLSAVACRTIGARGATCCRQIGKANATAASFIVTKVENRVHSSQERGANKPFLQKNRGPRC